MKNGKCAIKLLIGNKNYSSWSLRIWLLLKELNIPFEEEKLNFNDLQFKDKVEQHSKAGLVPVLVDGERCVWDSMAIAEYVAESFPDLGVWPQDRTARAFARSMCAEMHSGFANLRTQMPMNIAHRFPSLGWNIYVQRDVDRIIDLWSQARRCFGAGVEMLFGVFSVADAFFAPVVWRFVGYEVAVPAIAQRYMDAIRALPAMQEWVDAAIKENDFVAQDEPYRSPPA
jgi:glutathione S-transferase